MQHLKPGDIGFIMHHDNKISKAIAWFMGSLWSHTFMVLESTDQRTYLLETSDFHVTIGSLEIYLMDDNVSLEVYSKKSLDDDTRKKMVHHGLKLYGTIYGYLQLLSLGIRRLLMKIGIHVPNFIRQGVVCDQVVLYAYNHSGLEPFDELDPEGYDTEELFQLVKSNGFELVLKKDL